MTNHGNRSKLKPRANPLPLQIREARETAGLTQTQAAAVIHTSCNTWQKWEAGDRAMHPAFWELFKIKTNND